MKAESVIIKVTKDGKPSLVDYKATTSKALKQETAAIIKSLKTPTKPRKPRAKALGMTGIYSDL